jgi:hypothetical protein
MTFYARNVRGCRTFGKTKMIHAKGKWAELSALTRGTMKNASEIVVTHENEINLDYQGQLWCLYYLSMVVSQTKIDEGIL